MPMKQKQCLIVYIINNYKLNEFALRHRTCQTLHLYIELSEVSYLEFRKKNNMGVSTVGKMQTNEEKKKKKQCFNQISKLLNLEEKNGERIVLLILKNKLTLQIIDPK